MLITPHKDSILDHGHTQGLMDADYEDKYVLKYGALEQDYEELQAESEEVTRQLHRAKEAKRMLQAEVKNCSCNLATWFLPHAHIRTLLFGPRLYVEPSRHGHCGYPCQGWVNNCTHVIAQAGTVGPLSQTRVCLLNGRLCLLNDQSMLGSDAAKHFFERFLKKRTIMLEEHARRSERIHEPYFLRDAVGEASHYVFAPARVSVGRMLSAGGEYHAPTSKAQFSRPLVRGPPGTLPSSKNRDVVGVLKASASKHAPNGFAPTKKAGKRKISWKDDFSVKA